MKQYVQKKFCSNRSFYSLQFDIDEDWHGMSKDFTEGKRDKMSEFICFLWVQGKNECSVAHMQLFI